MKISKYFSPRQLMGLAKAGDVILPGTRRSPSFSETGCIEYVDRMAAYLSPDDVSDLQTLLTLFRWTPRWAIRRVLALCSRNGRFPGVIGSTLRKLDIGIKGAITSLYYSNLHTDDFTGEPVHDVIGWHPRIATADKDQSREPSPDINTNDPSGEDIAAIFARARRAQADIHQWPVRKRLEFIDRLRQAILDRKDEILDRVQQDTGKSRVDALTAEIFGTLDHLDYLKKNAVKELSDRRVPTPLALMGKKSRIYYEPLGVALIISPWNYPFYQAIVPITTAFVVGNAVIYKPSGATPLTGLVESLLDDADFHDGWVQVVYGEGGRIGDTLVDQRPDKIFFIGSQRVGRHLMEKAAAHLIPVELEMGGKDPMVVFEDANIQRAAAGAVWGAFTNTGQSCTSVEKLYVQEGIFDDLTARIVEETKRFRLGRDDDGSADIGPMTTASQTAVVARHVADAEAKGAAVLTGGDWDRQSDTIPPIVITGITPDMLLETEETFGPILPIIPFRDEAETVAMANDTVFGLSASVWTNDMDRADRVARAIVTGNVSINNVMLTEGNHALPFGGAKQSGIGRYKGAFGFTCFANVKSVLIDKNSGKMEANWFPYTPEKYRLLDDLTRQLYTPGLLSLLKGMITGLRLEHYVKKLGKRSE
jgi:acyl-CoA reductase-like NAD-dependent aldehyde dehydrogenase